MPLTLDSDAPAVAGPGCPVDCTVSALGSRASMLLLRQAFYGDRRFEDFVQHTGISEATVAKRLHELIDAGVLVKRPYREAGSRARHEYELTAAGEELLPVVIGLFNWGKRHLEDTDADLDLIGPDDEPVDVTILSAAGQRLSSSQIRVRPSSEARA